MYTFVHICTYLYTYIQTGGGDNGVRARRFDSASESPSYMYILHIYLIIYIHIYIYARMNIHMYKQEVETMECALVDLIVHPSVLRIYLYIK